MPEMFGKPISKNIFIAAPVEKVYDTITSGDGWNQFFTRSSEIDPQPGGKFVFRWKDWGPNFYTNEAEGLVVAAEKPNLFSFQWYPIGKDNPTTLYRQVAPVNREVANVARAVVRLHPVRAYHMDSDDDLDSLERSGQ